MGRRGEVRCERGRGEWEGEGRGYRGIGREKLAEKSSEKLSEKLSEGFSEKLSEKLSKKLSETFSSRNLRLAQKPEVNIAILG